MTFIENKIKLFCCPLYHIPAVQDWANNVCVLLLYVRSVMQSIVTGGVRYNCYNCYMLQVTRYITTVPRHSWGQGSARPGSSDSIKAGDEER